MKPEKTVKLARLEYVGSWDPEPGGWKRLAAVMHNQNKIDLQVDHVKLGEGKLSGYKIAHITAPRADVHDVEPGWMAEGGVDPGQQLGDRGGEQRRRVRAGPEVLRRMPVADEEPGTRRVQRPPHSR